MRAFIASVSALAIFANLSCGATLSRAVIEHHPRIELTVIEPQVVERSDPFPPPWTRAPERGAESFVAFLGQSSGPTIDAAKQEAMRDLLSAVSNFVSVEVESESLDIATQDTQDVRSVVKTRSGSKIEGIKADEIYWERVAASPSAADSVNFRYFVHARVPKVEIVRARAKKLAERREKSGKRTVVILPFRPVLTTPDLTPLANAFAEELGRRLAGVPNIHVADAGIVAALLAGGKSDSEAESLEAVRDAFLPDVVIAGGYQLHEKKLRVTFAVHEAGKNEPAVAAPIERTYDKLFELQDALIEAIKKELGAVDFKTEARPAANTENRLAAFELYHQAYALYSAGQNQGAIDRLLKALQLEPDYAEAHLRLGRVRERMGRYGFVPPLGPTGASGAGHAQGAQLNPLVLQPASCVDWALISAEPREVFLSAIERPADQFTAPDADALSTRENVDHIFGAISFLAQGGATAEPAVSNPAKTAIGSYYQAYRSARARGDERLVQEVLLVIADLMARVDRYDHALYFYRAVESYGVTRQDLHLLSLARFGQGRVARLRADYPAAEALLLDALRNRGVLGEKPYLLEIFNELGGLAVEMSDYKKARVYFKRALQIAEELDDPYFRAVLANNLGALNYLGGDAIQAARDFDRAYEYLKNIKEAEGQIAAGLNVARASSGRGDLDRARAYIDEAQRIVRETAQESRLAAVHAERAQLAMTSGDRLAAIRELLRGWTIERRLDRLTEMLRAGNSVIAAEYYLLSGGASGGAGENVWSACLRDEAHQLLTGGYGSDSSSLARRYWRRYSYGYRGYYEAPAYYQQDNYRAVPGGGLAHLYALMNAEALARIGQ